MKSIFNEAKSDHIEQGYGMLLKRNTIWNIFATMTILIIISGHMYNALFA